MTLFVYSFEDAEGNEQGWTTTDPDQAQLYALEHSLKCIANEFEWADSELLWDYTPATAEQE